ncbi:MAG: endonuclease III [Treponema sp.]|nr:endonuclease III [Treponema sp.]
MNENSDTAQPGWPAIFASLERWREKTLAGAGTEDTAITTIAEEYEEGPGKPWAILVSTILSLRTKDDVTRAASRRLLEKAPGPARLLALGAEETARLAYPAGFYRTKAASLVKISQLLLERYGGQVPADMDALLSLPGVGRKTANLVITEAFGMYGICVDIHVHRICNRAGWIRAQDPEKTETALRETLPKQYWKRINGLLVLYGQNVCRPQSPFCSRCVMPSHCLRVGVDRSR